MNRIYLLAITILFLVIFPLGTVFAESPYVLPYPSAMPGSIFYKLNLIQEEILKFWYFGDFGRFKYNLSQSDKYLVEAKTLFDYKQYLLALNALKKSDNYFRKIEPSIMSAKKNNKNTIEKERVLKEAAQKHIEELLKLKQNLPVTFEWRSEKELPRILNLKDTFENSIKVRQQIL